MRFQLGFERRFEQIRIGYLRFLTLCVDHAGVFLVVFVRGRIGVGAAF